MYHVLWQISYLQFLWLGMTFGIGLFGSLSLFAPAFSTFINDLVKYGKSQSSERSILHRAIEVPKRWFTHFYIIGTITLGIGIIMIILCYWFDMPPSEKIRKRLRYLSSPNRKATINEFTTLLTTIVLFVHAVRRLWESLFLSVYSNTKMNVLHYLVGWFHYLFLPIVILAEAPGFITVTQKPLDWSAVTTCQVLGLVLFVVASACQHQCLYVLASMRRNYLGNITTYAHGIPVTGFFVFISCPHFLFEIIIYISVYLVLNLRHQLWATVILFVITNQVIAALITHNWYKEKYKKLYPENRKALVPFLL